jgi:hypothetical protein
MTKRIIRVRRVPAIVEQSGMARRLARIETRLCRLAEELGVEIKAPRRRCIIRR